MSVSYHLMPIDKKTESFVDLNSLKIKLENDFSIFAELMINYPDKFNQYFAKHELYFDFIYSLRKSEISKITYQPENLKLLFIDLLEILKTKEGFPIKSFNYFNYEGLMESTYLYVYLDGNELNKFVEDKIYHNDSKFEINTSFDKWNNYSVIGGDFEQRNTIVYIKTEEGERFRSNLDLCAFPNVIKINGTQRNINLGKEINQVSLILKTPYEHLYPMFQNLIEVCNFCIDRNYGIKSFISC